MAGFLYEGKDLCMRYVISDIHGCYEEFLRLLEKIDLKDEDWLYILGDMVDRGPEPMKVVQDVMARPNVCALMGNHDFMAWVVLSRLNEEIEKGGEEIRLEQDDMINYMNWVRNGGRITEKKFYGLAPAERKSVLAYLKDLAHYEELQAAGRHYVLVHAGIHGFQEEKDLGSYDYSDLIFHRTDYGKRYYRSRNTYVVTGHTPTIVIREDGQPLVYEQHGHIAIDCGCVYGGKLAAYCLDTQKIYYVDRMSKGIW